MSVIDATLFYSRFDKKSSDMKQIIDSLNIDMDFVPVDNKKVKELLMQDTKCKITEVPSVVVTYTDGGHKTFAGKRLDSWFQQILENYRLQSAPPEQPSYTTIETPQQVQVESFEQHTSILDQPNVGSGMGSGSAVQHAIATQHIVGSESDIKPDPTPIPTRKEVKKEGMSAAEIASEMAKAREEYEEQINNNPLIQV